LPAGRRIVSHVAGRDRFYPTPSLRVSVGAGDVVYPTLFPVVLRRPANIRPSDVQLLQLHEPAFAAIHHGGLAPFVWRAGLPASRIADGAGRYEWNTAGLFRRCMAGIRSEQYREMRGLTIPEITAVARRPLLCQIAGHVRQAGLDLERVKSSSSISAWVLFKLRKSLQSG
jgi:hypothetical protein